MVMENKERFLTVYSDLPIDIRKEIVLVIDNQPITWNVAYNEIDRETPLGQRILEKLIKMELI